MYCPKVLVYKSPGLHVGDVKVFEAIWHKEFGEIIGNGKHAIFFSVKGARSVVDEIANSDLDGDQYWCCTNPQVWNSFRVVFFYFSLPMDYLLRSYDLQYIISLRYVHICITFQLVKAFVSSEVWKNPGTPKNASKEKLYKNDEVDKQHFEVFLKARFKPW